MAPKRDEFANCLFFTANALARTTWHMAEEIFAAMDLTPTQAFLIMAVVREPGIHMRVLARRVMLDPSTITRTIERMEMKELLFREQLGAGRSVQVFPGPKGIEKEPDVRAAWKHLNLRFNKRLGPSESERVSASLAEVNEFLVGD